MYYYNEDDQRISLKGKHGPTEFTNLAIDYIKKSAKQDKPFAMFLSWNPPHDPWTKDNVPKKNYDKFKNVKFDLPENFKPDADPYMDRYPKFCFSKKGKQWKKTYLENEYQENQRCYYAMVNNLDEQFGRIMKQLKSSGLDDNTIVVFTSDHGEMFTSQGRMFKLIFYDEAARIPFLVKYPGQKKSGSTDACINTPDIMPTLLGLMRLEENIPDEVEGDDLSYIFKDKKGKEPKAAFLQGMGHTFQWKDGFEWRALRDKQFTYAKYLRDGKELLFDRKTDPYMKNNVINNSQYAEEANRQRKCMNNKMRELKDEFHKCTWYRDNWMHKTYSIKAGAKGEFAPLPPIQPKRRKRLTN